MTSKVSYAAAFVCEHWEIIVSNCMHKSCNRLALLFAIVLRLESNSSLHEAFFISEEMVFRTVSTALDRNETISHREAINFAAVTGGVFYKS